MNSCLILAAGNGTRMKLSCPKVLAKVMNVPMLAWVLDSVLECNIINKCVVTGYKSEVVQDFLSSNGYDCEVAFQKERKGTAHAVMAANEFLKKNVGSDILILGGDSPFLDFFTINSAYNFHKENSNSVTIISANFENPFGYGRILRDQDGNVNSIVEERDANESERKIREINSGAYWFNVSDLLNAIGSVSVSRESGELYLTSVISILIKKGLKVGAYCAEDYTVALGANTYEQLESLNLIARSKIINSFISKGVNIPDCNSVLIGKNVEIGEGTTILSDVTINSFTKIGKNCTIGPSIILSGESIPDNTNLIYSSNVCVGSQNFKSEEVIEYAF